MRDAAFVKACELVVEFRKQASHWKKLLFATSDELSAARHALSDLAKACEDLQKDQDCSFNNAVSDSIRKILGAVEGEFTIHAAERCVKVKDSLRDERDDLRKIVEMVHADLGIQPGDHIGEAISELKKEASDATARQRMTEARALNYSLQADEARREIERLRAKLNAKTIEWPEWAKEGTRVRVRSTRYAVTQCNFVGGEEFVVAKADEYEWALMSKHQFWAHVSDLEPVAEHVAPLVVSPQVGDTVRLIKRPSTADYDGRQWDHTWGEAGEIAVVNYVGLCVNVNRNGWKNDWPLSCVEVVK